MFNLFSISILLLPLFSSIGSGQESATTIRSFPRINVSIDESGFPDLKRNLESTQNWARQYTSAYVEELSQKWQHERSSPVNFPSAALILADTDKMISQSSDAAALYTKLLPDLNTKGKEAVFFADGFGTLEMLNLFSKRLDALKINVTPGVTNSDGSIQTSEIEKLETRFNSIQEKFEKETIPAIDRDLQLAEGSLKSLSIQLIAMILFLIASYTFWHRSQIRKSNV